MAHLLRRFPMAAFSPTPSPVSFDAVSALQYSTSSPVTWSHTINGNCLVIPFIQETNGTSTGTMSATVGGQAMSSLYYALYFNAVGYYAYVGMFGLINPPTGAQTISISQPTNSNHWFQGGSLSYRNVSSFGSVVANITAANGPATVTATSSPLQRVVNILAMWASTPTSYSQTARIGPWNTSSAIRPGVIGDAPGAASVTFSETATDYGANLGCLALPLIPLP